MANDLTSRHKRSRSSLALSLLHRDRSKDEDKTREGSAGSADDNLSIASSKPPPPAIIPSQPHSSRLHLGRHRANRLNTSSMSGSTTALAPPSPNQSLAESSAAGGSQLSLDRGVSIDQTVRVFRIFEALRNGDTAAIAKAIRETSCGSDPETRKSTSSFSSSTPGGPLEGTTILHLAVQCADQAVVEYVFTTAAAIPGCLDINARDSNGNTPLHLAAMLSRSPVVRLLLEQKDINDSLPNYQGRLPLDLARSAEIFQQLQMSRSLFLDSTAKEVQSLVARADYEGLEKLLKEPRVQTVLDVNGGELVTDPVTLQTAGTLLHEAARKRDHKLIQILLFHGADPFRRDRKGKLPQDVTKDDKTRAVLKKSPAAAAAQRGIQEQAILGNQGSPAVIAANLGVSADISAPAGKEGREMKGYLKKWTNYTSGYKLRWFVLEDGVLSYYKNQDDAGSACRGAINMRIAKLYMDPQDKQRFEIQGKSSVKYHLKANHIVEAKRWFWALNNAIQLTKDEAKEEEKKKARDATLLRQKIDQIERGKDTPDSFGETSSAVGRRSSRTNKSISSIANPPRVTLQGTSIVASSVVEEDEATGYVSQDPSVHEISRIHSHGRPINFEDDAEAEDDFGDDASSHETQPANKDAFNITAQSAKLQLDLLGQISAALAVEKTKSPSLAISSSTVVQALSSYEAAVKSLKSLLGDLLKISRDRDAYWQYRLDREADVRRLWEDSMAHLAKEQETLEGKIGESEDKRKRTKRALKEALESTNAPGFDGRSPSMGAEGKDEQEAVIDEDLLFVEDKGKPPLQRKSSAQLQKRKSVLAAMANISDSEDDEDEEFFDAIDQGDVRVVDQIPQNVEEGPHDTAVAHSWEGITAKLQPSFRGYEDPVRKRLKMDADDRPKISLWSILKSMIGKDMTKMTLPVSFNEPTSLLQRVAEDMEYTDLLDTAAERTDSSERLVYVAAFAASEYASTIGRVAKPFNPLLGETYEYARPDKGYRFFIEQVSHHPPIGAAWAESPKWDYYGESAVKSKFYGKSFDINPLGTWFLKLRPSSGGEELYTWKKVTSSVIGIITGSPTVDNYGPMEIKNHSTGEVCMLDFQARGWRASSAFVVRGKILEANGMQRWSIGGRWNDKIYARLTPGYDAVVEGPGGNGAPARTSTDLSAPSTEAFLVWQANGRPTGIPFNLTPFVVTLNALPDALRPHLAPTDTRLRPDQRAMEDGEYDLAASEKNRVEEKQRARRRLREGRGEEFIPRWFTRSTCAITGEQYWVSNGEYWAAREKGKWNNVEDIY
ncbi:MAG: hypothetical protein M1829_006924 [Trizodia sp. TS-e1964]|nr:MAG: hypothetical protein M1829_006924 [Trizodia sp. TS-e1964]